MTIDEAIKVLESAKKDGVTNIIHAFWEAKDFSNFVDGDADWAAICQQVEDNMDWSRTWADIIGLIDAQQADIA